jgi:hypothetical protein
MQNILDLASEFYKMNDIEINTQKSAAVIINSRNTTATLTLQNEMVPILAPSEETRYLGIYISSEGINKPTIAKVEKEINFITSKIIFKAITDKQAHYLIHNILHPIIEYRTQTTFLTPSKCEAWDRKICNAFRRKAKLPKDMPTNAIHHLRMYNIKRIGTLQAESKVTSTTIRLNSSGLTKELFIQQIIDHQLSEWLPDSPLARPMPSTNRRNTHLITGLSQILSEQGLCLSILDYPIYKSNAE